MNISDILRHKTSGNGDASERPAVVTVTSTTTVAGLVATLTDHRIGAAVVLDGSEVAGIVSERDIVRRLASHGGSSMNAPVSEIMTSSVFSCSPDDAVEQVAQTMTDQRIRHMPVLHDGTLVGIVSIGDVVVSRIRQLEQDRGQLEQYIAG